MLKTIKKRGNSEPGAWIVNPKDRGRFSIKGGKCYLENDSQFEIEIFNPLKISVLADIKLNGQSISKTGLVVKPGQRVYLDCFIDDKRKFKFSTYEIENSDEAIEATSSNGLLEVFFYKEDVITLDNWREKFDKIIIEKWYPVYPYYPAYPYTSYPYWGYNSVLTGGSTTNVGFTLTNNTGGITSGSLDYVSGTSVVNSYSSNNTTMAYTSNSASIETGRVERGEKSKQKFKEVHMYFENHYIHSVIIQILPESRKPAEIKTTKINIELPKGNWTKEQLEEIKEVVNQYVWKEDTNENRKDMNDTIELIKKLSDLYTSGILTDEEFKNKKTELLSKI